MKLSIGTNVKVLFTGRVGKVTGIFNGNAEVRPGYFVQFGAVESNLYHEEEVEALGY